MQRLNIYLNYILLLPGLLFFLTACFKDVPHDNPIDPLNKERGYTISGQVNTLYAPNLPINNAVLSIIETGDKVFSDNNGRYSMSELEPGNYKITCTADGYATDSIQVELNGDIVVDFFLDGLPYFERISLATRHISRFFPIDEIFLLELETEVDDPDGISDINRVYVEIKEFAILDTLDATADADRYTLTLSIDDLPVNSIHNLIGKAFYFYIEDDAGIVVKSEARFLTRIIDPTPVLINPVNLQSVSSDTIDFKWEKVRLPYNFNHKIEIFQINFGLLTKVTDIENIPSSENSLKYLHSFPRADYIWILTVMDDFGNSSSSREGSFRIN